MNGLQPLPVQLRWQLSHLRGYLELGMIAEAAAEYKKIDPQRHEDSEVLKVATCLFQEQQDWVSTQRTAGELTRREPEHAAWWITLAYATRRAESLEAATKILIAAEKLHPKEATIAFNLGCYACLRGDLGEAKAYVEKAIGLNERFRDAAETDPDLGPLRASDKL